MTRDVKNNKFGGKSMDNLIEGNHLREYIYIDNIEINSILAQLYRGLNIKTTSSTSKSEGASKAHSQGGKLSAGGSIGIPFLAKGKGDAELSLDRETSSSVESIDQKSVEAVLSDYSVEVLENDLKDQQLLVNINDAQIGDIIHLKDNFNITDFNSMKGSTEPDLISEILKITLENQLAPIKQQISSIKKSGASSKDTNYLTKQIHDLTKEVTEEQKAVMENFKSINLLGKYGSTIFKDSVLVNGKDFISYAELKNFRLSAPQLNMLHDSPRKINVIGIVENQFKDVESIRNGDVKEASPSELGKTTNLLLQTILANFDLITEGTLLIKPLAIYFDD